MLDGTKVFFKNKESFTDNSVRYIINQGGTSSSKTYSILQILLLISIKYPLKIDIVGLSVPHLKSGVLNDMQSICRNAGFCFDDYYKEGDKVFKMGSGSINFLAFDKLGKAHGGRRDILYLNEANHLNYNIAEQLMIRTRKKIFIDYNPTNAFWVHKKIMKDEPEKVSFIKSTYKDNKFLEQSIIDSIESRRGDGNNNFWRVYGLGELGIAEGLVFNNFEQLDFDINSFSNYRNGIDWGFSADPFAFVRSAIQNDCLYICKEIYQQGLLNKDSAPLVKDIINRELVVCDSAEPKSIADFNSMGINAIPAKKGAGSIESGIKFLQSFKKIYVHPNCPNVYDEFCNYQWKQDKNGDDLPVPIDAFNHCLVGDTLITTDKGLIKIKDIKVGDRVLTRQGFKPVLWSGVSDYNRKVYKVTTDKGNYIIGTNNHKVLTLNGFCDIDSIRYGDKLLIGDNKKCQKQSLLLKKSGADILNQKEEAIENIIKAVQNICIISFGKNLLESVKRGMLYITRTVIVKIMTFLTLKKLVQQSICKNTHLMMKENKKLEKILKKEIILENGILVKMVLNGIKTTQKTLSLVYLTLKKLSVNVVEKLLNQKLITTNFVQTPVKAHLEEKAELMTLLSIANGAEKNLQQINIQKLGFAVARVLTVQEQEKANEVYDLTVDECHEFFANGILVHNCIDGLRYSLESDMPSTFAKFSDWG